MLLSTQSQASNDPFTRALFDPFLPALGVGTLSGASGLAFGLVAGSLRSAHPGLFAAVTGAQWFGLGSSYWYARSAISSAAFGNQLRRDQELACSTVAGSLAGGINGAIRSRSNIIPGAIVVGLFGFAGQYGYNYVSDSRSSVIEKGPLLQRFSEMKWVPLKSLSNQEYEQMLQEKLLSTDADIAIIDERIAALRSSKAVTPPNQESKPG